jgi:hypothetical protein
VGVSRDQRESGDSHMILQGDGTESSNIGLLLYIPDEGSPAADASDLGSCEHTSLVQEQEEDRPFTERTLGVHAGALLRDKVELEPFGAFQG